MCLSRKSSQVHLPQRFRTPRHGCRPRLRFWLEAFAHHTWLGMFAATEPGASDDRGPPGRSQCDARKPGTCSPDGLNCVFQTIAPASACRAGRVADCANAISYEVIQRQRIETKRVICTTRLVSDTLRQSCIMYQGLPQFATRPALINQIQNTRLYPVPWSDPDARTDELRLMTKVACLYYVDRPRQTKPPKFHLATTALFKRAGRTDRSLPTSTPIGIYADPESQLEFSIYGLKEAIGRKPAQRKADHTRTGLAAAYYLNTTFSPTRRSESSSRRDPSFSFR